MAAAYIVVDAIRRGSGLALTYIVSGNLDEIRIPAVAVPSRRDELWQHTCFEAFVRTQSGDEYYEFNFSPSTHWAAYRFSAYRSGMCAASEIEAPIIETGVDADCFTLNALVELDRFSHLSATTSWRLGLSALIEDKIGRKAYWALAHPSGKPDFHHPACFTQELSPVVRL